MTEIDLNVQDNLHALISMHITWKVAWVPQGFKRSILWRKIWNPFQPTVDGSEIWRENQWRLVVELPDYLSKVLAPFQVGKLAGFLVAINSMCSFEPHVGFLHVAWGMLQPLRCVFSLWPEIHQIELLMESWKVCPNIRETKISKDLNFSKPDIGQTVRFINGNFIRISNSLS